MVITDYCINRILEKAENIYNAKTVNKETLGNSANMIFELFHLNNPIILRISEYTEYKEKHINFLKQCFQKSLQIHMMFTIKLME